MSNGVEERSLADAVHIVNIGPQLDADPDDVHPVSPGSGPGTARLVKNGHLQSRQRILYLNVDNLNVECINLIKYTDHNL